MRPLSEESRRLLTIGAAVVGVALIAWEGLKAFGTAVQRRARERFEESVSPQSPASQHPSRIPDAENATALFMEGFLTLDVSREEHRRLHELTERRPDAWTSSERAWVRKLTERERPALERFRAAAELPPATLPRLLAVKGSSLSKGEDLLRAAIGLELSGGDVRVPTLEALGALIRTYSKQGKKRFDDRSVQLESCFLFFLRWMVETPQADSDRLQEMLGLLPEVDVARTFARRMQVVAARQARSTDLLAAKDPFSLLFGNLPGYYELAQASILDELRRMVEASRSPAAFREYVDSHPDLALTPGEYYVGRQLPFYLDWLLLPQATETSRNLARTAVTLRLKAEDGAAYPESPPEVPPDRFAAGTITWELHEDGSAVLDIPETRAAVEERFGFLSSPLPPFHWKLPPPDPKS